MAQAFEVWGSGSFEPLSLARGIVMAGNFGSFNFMTATRFEVG